MNDLEYVVPIDPDILTAFYIHVAMRIVERAIMDWHAWHIEFDQPMSRIRTGASGLLSHAGDYGFYTPVQELTSFFTGDWGKFLIEMLGLDYDATLESLGIKQKKHYPPRAMWARQRRANQELKCRS